MNPRTAHGYALLMPCVSLCLKKRQKRQYKEEGNEKEAKESGQE